MELTEELKREFIFSLERILNSINNVIETDYYDYFQITEIHKTYIEYCKSFNSIEIFSDIKVNTKIKIPRIKNKFYWSGKMNPTQYILFGRYSWTHHDVKQKTNDMFEEIKTNLKLILYYLKNPDIESNDNYINELMDIIKNQPKIAKKKQIKDKIINFSITIFVAIIIIQK